MRAQRAAAVRHEMITVYEAHRDRVLKRLITTYRSGKGIDHDVLVGAVAELSGMEEIIDRLTREITQSENEV